MLFLLTLLPCALGMAMPKATVMQPFLARNAFKLISGINNFDPVLVRNIALAAEQGGASHIDIACDPALVAIAKASTTLPVCVSSVTPMSFVAAVAAGADMIEIGNFDGLYEQGITYSADDIVALTQESRRLLPHIALSVTIPHSLSLDEQVSLAIRLEKCGADVLQTEGKLSANVASMGVQELIEVAAPTLASAFALSKVVSIPVMCSSGLTDVTAVLALAVGANGVGVGSMVNKLGSLNQMVLATSAIAASIGRKTGAASAKEARVVMVQSVEAKVSSTI